MTSQTMSDPADPISRTSGPTNLLVLPGDGIGPDIVAATVEVLSAADRRFRLDLRRSRLQYGADRVPGDPERPELLPPDRHADLSAHRQRRRQP